MTELAYEILIFNNHRKIVLVQSLVKTQSDSSQDQVEYLPILPTTSNLRKTPNQGTGRFQSW